jgi:3-oxoadipate enol-lactonase
MHATIGRQSIWYEAKGAGPPVLLIMGFGLSGRAWAPQVQVLHAHHKTIIFDNRGVGSSPASNAPYGFADLAADAVGLMDHLGVERAHIVGVSMGGMVAQHLTLAHPARVQSLTLIATTPGGSLHHLLPPPYALWLFLRANMSRGTARMGAMRKLLYAHPTPIDSEAAFDADTLAALRAPAAANALRHQLWAVLRHNVTTQLHQVHAPTLIIKPRHDRLVRPHNSERLKALMPFATLVEVDAGHGATNEAALDVNAALLRHFARNEAT